MSTILSICRAPSINFNQNTKYALKLSMIMGPMWIIEIIGWTVGNHGVERVDAENAFLFFDVINSLQVSRLKNLKSNELQYITY